MTTRKIKSKPLYRSYELKRETVDEEARTVELSFSSETRDVIRFFGREILDHAAGSVRLDRINANGPLLMDHNPSDQVGSLESVTINGRKGSAIARFSKSQRGQEVFQDVLDNIRSSVSVGYIPHRMILEESDDDVDTYRVTDWEPMEVSLVSIPADVSVGVGRADDREYEIEITDNRTNEEEKMSEVKPEAPAVTIDIKAEREAARKEEQTRIREISAMGDKFEQSDIAKRCIDEGQSIDQAREAVLQALGSRAPLKPAEDPAIGLDAKEKRAYSFLRMMNAMANPNDRRAQEAAAFERECSEAAAVHLKRTPQGMLVPHDILVDTRDLNAGTATAGGHTVATDLLSGSFIELLRNRMALNAVNATILTDLNGDIAIPRQTGGATAYWVAESGAPTESQQAFDQVTLSPKTVGAYTDYSRKLLLQSSIGVENFVRSDLATVIALAIDDAGLEGTGSGNQPTGLINTSGVATSTIATAAAPTYVELVEFETDVAAANADVANMAYITTAAIRGACKTTEKASGTAQFIWEPGNTINGYNTVISNQVSANGIYFGNWADLLIGMWSGLDILVDPYTGSTSGTVRIVALQDVDVAARHGESFCINV